MTGDGTLIGGFGGVGFGDIACGPDGTLYGWGVSGGGGLWTVDKGTGAATDLGGNGIGTSGGGISCTSAGILYVFPLSASNGANFYTADTVTGDVTDVGDLSGYDPGGGSTISAAAFDAADLLYGAGNHHDASLPNVDLVTIDVGTGVEALIGASVTGLDALAWSLPATSPSTAVAGVQIAFGYAPFDASPVFVAI